MLRFPYPEEVVSEDQKRRWRLSIKSAEKFARNAEGDETTIWMATRSFYNSDMPTGDGDYPDPDEFRQD